MNQAIHSTQKLECLKLAKSYCDNIDLLIMEAERLYMFLHGYKLECDHGAEDIEEDDSDPRMN